MRTQPELPRRRGLAGRRRLVATALSIALAGATPFIGARPASAAATTVLFPQASPSGFPAGVSIYDTVTVAQGVNPTGTLTFTVYGPADPTCGVPLFASTKAVAGNGYYASEYFMTSAAGTYRWIARYSGDAQNSPAATVCDDPKQAVAMGKRSPNLNGTASAPSPMGSITDTATLANGLAPTGSLTFTLYGPDNMVCSGPPIFTSERAVTGNGTYTSEPFTPAVRGTYVWITAYSGDANHQALRTICADSAQDVIITTVGLPPTTTTTTTRPPTTTTLPARTTTLPSTTTTTRPPTTTTTAPTTTLPPTTTTLPATTTTLPTTTTTTTRPATTTTTRPTTTLPPTTTTTRPAPTTTTTKIPDGPSETARFVDRAHRDLLGRAPSGAESTFWIDVLASGFSRDNFAAILVSGDEFRRMVVGSYYQSYLGRPGTPAEVDTFVRLIAEQGWTFEFVATLLLGSDEFYADHGASRATYVDALYAMVLGVAPEASGHAYWVDRLARGTDRYTVALAFLSSSMAHQNVVRAAYGWLLDRPADAAGLSFWTSQLDKGLRQEYVFAFFVGSGEYLSKS